MLVCGKISIFGRDIVDLLGGSHWIGFVADNQNIKNPSIHMQICHYGAGFKYMVM
jgi:hypothetical protein